jgi:hypothetical protein
VRQWKRLVGPPSERDSGQLPIALIVVVFFGLVMAVFTFGLPWGQATDQKAGSQAAGDAAALAAGEQIKEDLPEEIRDRIAGADNRGDLENLLSFLGRGYGREGALEYADLNKSTVQSYEYDWQTGQIDVRVRSEAETDGRHSFSDSQAEVGLRLDNCVLDDDEVPTPEPTEPDPDEGEDEGEGEDEEEEKPNIGTELRCGDLVLRFTIGGEDGRPTLESSLDDLEDLFRITLTA